MNREEMDEIDALVLLAADTVDDLEGARMAMENRLGALERDKGIDLKQAHPALLASAELLVKAERTAIRELERLMSVHYCARFIEESHGIGAKSIARLIATIGNPRIRPAFIDHDGTVREPERPRRGPGELWAYCGFAVVDGRAPRREKGVKVSWSPQARTRTRVCAESAYRQGRYRPAYVAAREKYDGAVHSAECRNQSRYSPNGCGTRDHPEWGEPGSPLRDGHKHARALRIVGKEILKDLYLATPLPM